MGWVQLDGCVMWLHSGVIDSFLVALEGLVMYKKKTATCVLSLLLCMRVKATTKKLFAFTDIEADMCLCFH